MFKGTFKYTVDMKGRICIPPEYREEIGTEFVCRVEHRPVYNIQCMKESQLDLEESRYTACYENFQNIVDIDMGFCSTVYDVKVDSQGRVMFPQEARERAGIGEDVYIVGSKTSFRIMSATNYVLYCAALDKERAEIDSAIASYRRNNMNKMAGLSADDESLIKSIGNSQHNGTGTDPNPQNPRNLQVDMNTLFGMAMNIATMMVQGMNGGFNNNGFNNNGFNNNGFNNNGFNNNGFNNGGFNNGSAENPAGTAGNNGTPDGGDSK